MKLLKTTILLLLITTTALHAQVGIGTNSPNASAKLDVTSTTQGFLPPRMTYDQRNAISTPASGLIVYCTNCGIYGEWQGYNGSAWTNISGATASAVLSVGTSFQGGIIAYIFQSGDPGYVAGQTHGLIAATSDQSSGIRWYNGSYTVTGATGTAIGTGKSNTNTIITSQGTVYASYAAGLAKSYNGGGYTDWYLPSIDELNKLYLNSASIGGFTTWSPYWSSSEQSNNAAYTLLWETDYNGYNGKDGLFLVRLVRSF
jgi:hypothetical protein